MNQVVSLLTPGGPAGPVASERNFSNANARGKAATPFSSLLERATYQAPERNSQNAKASRQRSARTEESSDESVRADRRAHLREKNRRDKTTEDQSLAGACAVNGQPVKPEVPVQTGGIATEPGAAETPAAVLADNAEVAVSTEVEGAAVSADGEATAVATSLLDGAVTPQSAEDLATALTPGSAVNANQITNTAVAATAVVGEMNLSAVADANVPRSSEMVDPTVVATAASGREAEVLLATGLETDVSTPAQAVVEDIVTATIAPEEARRAARAARHSWAETRENTRGIGGAKSSETMKTAIKKEEVAGVAQQLLPGAAPIAVSTLPTLPGEARRGSLGAISPAEALNQIGKFIPASVHADVAGTENQLDARATSPLVRVSELISREVRMFKRGGDDLVEVVLTPDAKTQISLRLQWREGQVEVQARCDLGDYQSLNTQWPQLQASLANHGVRLSHLSERTPTGFTEFFNNPNFSHQKDGERQAAHSGAAEPAAPSALPPAKATPAQPGVRGNRRLESWA